MCNLLNNFATWFFLSEAARSGDLGLLDHFLQAKSSYIDSGIQEILTYANNHTADKPNFLKPEQKIELQNAIHDNTKSNPIWQAMNNSTRNSMSLLSLANPEKVVKNIEKDKSKFPLDSFATLDEMIKTIDTHKLRNTTPGEAVGAYKGVTSIGDLLNHIYVNKISNQIRMGRKSGESGAGGDTGSLLMATAASRGPAPGSAEYIADIEKSELSTQVRELSDCLRRMSKETMTKLSNQISAGLKKIENMEKDNFEIPSQTGSGASTQKIQNSFFADLKNQSLGYYMAKFLQQLKPDGSHLFSEDEMQNLLQSQKVMPVKFIIQNKNFIPFVEEELRKNPDSPAAKGLINGAFLTAFTVSLNNALSKGTVGETMKQYKTMFGSTDGLLDNIKNATLEKRINNTLARNTKNLNDIDLLSKIEPGTALGINNIKELFFDLKYPFDETPKSGYSGIEFIDLYKRSPKQKRSDSTENFARKRDKYFRLNPEDRDNPITLKDDDSCDEKIAKIRKAFGLEGE
jgi:hypothetical protein